MQPSQEEAAQAIRTATDTLNRAIDHATITCGLTVEVEVHEANYLQGSKRPIIQTKILKEL